MSENDENNYQIIVDYYENIISSEDSTKHLILSSILPSIGIIGTDIIINDKYINDSYIRLILEEIIKLCSLSLELDSNLINNKEIKLFLDSLESHIRDEKLLKNLRNDLDLSDLSLLFPDLILHKEVNDFLISCLNSVSRELSPLKTKCGELALIEKVIERPALFWPTINQLSHILVKSCGHSVIADIAYNFRLAVESKLIKSQTIFDLYPNCIHNYLILFRLFERIDCIESGFNAKKFSIIQEICAATKQTPDSYVRLLLLIYPSVPKYIFSHKYCIQQNYFA